MKCMTGRTGCLISTGVLIAVLAFTGASVEAHCSRISKPVTFYFGVEVPTPDPNHPETVDTYHTDLEVSFTASGWDAAVSWDKPGGGLDIPPADALVYANSYARISLSSIPSSFEFIGARPNEVFWVLPQALSNGALPLGVAAEKTVAASLCSWNPGDSRGADASDKWFEVRLVGMRGPDGGEFSMWQADGINPPVVFFSTFDGGIGQEDVYYISAGSHVHMNWGFTQSGLYEVDFVISTVFHCDEALTADLAPTGDACYVGDCIVDFRDWSVIAQGWRDESCGDAAFPCAGAHLSLPVEGPVDWSDIAVFAAQWLECGYPGCNQDVE